MERPRLPKAKVFISYAHEDSRIVDQISSKLKSAGIDAQFDRLILKSGVHFLRKLLNAILDADLFILVWSKHSARSPFVDWELRHAALKDAEELEYRIIPIVIDDTPLPELVRGIQVANMQQGYNEAVIEQVIAGIKEFLQLEKVPPPSLSHKPLYTKYENAFKKLERLVAFLPQHEEAYLDARQSFFKKAYQALQAADPEIFHETIDDATPPFINRDTTLQKIRNLRIKYINIFGPSGYGKTYLLHAILQNWRLQPGAKIRWSSVIVDLGAQDLNSPEQFCRIIIQQLEPGNKPQNPGLFELASAIHAFVDNERRENSDLEEFLILCDNLDIQNQANENLIKWLIANDGPLGNEFQNYLTSMENAPVVRLVIASRSEIFVTYLGEGISFDKIEIERLTEADINDLLVKKCEDIHGREKTQKDNSQIVRRAKDIYTITGGHPHCMGEIADHHVPSIFQANSCNECDYFSEIVVPITVYEVLEQVELSKQYVLWCLSVFRHFDRYILKELRKHKILLSESEFVSDERKDLNNIIQPLIRASLVYNIDALRPMYSMEPALRSVLSRWMRTENNELFMRINDLACRICDTYLEGRSMSATANKGEVTSLYPASYQYYFADSLYYHAYHEKAVRNESVIEAELKSKIRQYASYLRHRIFKDVDHWDTFRKMLLPQWLNDQELKAEITEMANDTQLWQRLTSFLISCLDMSSN